MSAACVLDKIIEILDWVSQNIRHDSSKKNVFFRKRDGKQIIKDGFATGCTDYVMVFLEMVRSIGIHASYVECVESILNGSVKGHVYAKVIINKKTYYIDPTKRIISKVLPKNMKVIGEGSDYKELGFLNEADIKNKFLEVFK